MPYKVIVGTCVVCNKEGVESRHYNSTHNIRLGDYFYSWGNRHPTADPSTYACRKCTEKMSGPHEAIKHLVEKHPEVISVSQNEKSYEQVQEVGECGQSVDIVTIADLVDMLVDRRRAAEATAECLRMELSTPMAKVEDLRREIERKDIEILELQAKVDRLGEENTRLSQTARELNDDVQKLRTGVLHEKGRHALMELNR